MDVTLFITIAIALIGWVLAFIQMYKNRQWQDCESPFALSKHLRGCPVIVNGL